MKVQRCSALAQGHTASEVAWWAGRGAGSTRIESLACALTTPSEESLTEELMGNADHKRSYVSIVTSA